MNKVLPPLKAIRQHCLSCAGRPKDVRMCDTSDCFLFSFRMGKNPNRAGIGVGKRFKNGQFSSEIASSADSSGIISGSLGKDIASKDTPLKLAPSEEIPMSGTGAFRIERSDKELIIRLCQEQ